MTSLAASALSSLVSGPTTNSASPLLFYLEEDNEALKASAVKKLLDVVDLHWAEISDSLETLESLSEDPSFPAAEAAAAVCSKCFYYLQEYNDALKHAMNAGPYFDVNSKSEYMEIMLSKCIDEYISLRNQQISASLAASSAAIASGEMEVETTSTVQIPEKLESIIDRMFHRCYNNNCFEQALGLALDTQSLEKVRETLTYGIKNEINLKKKLKDNILNYAFKLINNSFQNNFLNSRQFRLKVIELLVEFYHQEGENLTPDYTNIIYGMLWLNKSKEAGDVLLKLLRGDMKDALLAYQIAFDLLESENQGFILNIIKSIEDRKAEFAQLSEEKKEDDSDEDSFIFRLKKLYRILLGELSTDLTLNFLFRQSYTTPTLMGSIRNAVESKLNVLHSASIIAHAFLYAGTTRDGFMRNNLPFLGKASDWAKFSVVGSIGVVHKGHVHESMNLLKPYFRSGGPRVGSDSTSYSEGGALFALGLIHANKGGAENIISSSTFAASCVSSSSTPSTTSSVIQYLSDAIDSGEGDMVFQHGAYLGLGLTAMATGSESLYEKIRQNLFTTNDAIAGEAAAYCLGLIMIGQSDNSLIERDLTELLTFLHNTDHEKIIRALSLALAMMVYGKEDSADGLITTLLKDRDPIIRYGGVFALAMAYSGTGSNASIKKLLHVAVSDVSDDVRRAAVMCLGFILFRTPELVPMTVNLLSESFNAHVRYGACLAVGIACAGTAMPSAIDLLNKLLKDQVDFVRQGALISLAMVLQQTSETRTPFVLKFRALCNSLMTDKSSPTLAKTGAIIALGILEAGGNNVVISLQSRNGFVRMGSVVGMMMFLQYWFWYPLHFFLSLSFAPTFVIGLNKDFDIPTDFTLLCSTAPSMFSYPKSAEDKKENEKKLVTTELSTTKKAKAREARKEAKKLARQMSLESDAGSIPMERVSSYLSVASTSEKEKEKEKEVKKKKEKEPNFFILNNPSRLIPAQLPYISLNTETDQSNTNISQRYTPIRPNTTPAGIVILVDGDPQCPEKVIRVDRLNLGQEDEAEAPEPFVWDSSTFE